MPKDDNLNSYLHIRLTTQERLRLAIIADHQQRTLAAVSRLAMQAYFDLPENRKLLAAVDEAQTIAQAAPK